MTMEKKKYVLVYVITKDKSEARKIANALLDKRVVACTNVFPVESTFRWKGKIEKASEYCVIAKTKQALAKKVISVVKKVHSYSVPCILVLPVLAGNPDFLAWIDEAVK